MIECRANFEGAKISAAAQKGGLAGLYKSAAFLMRVARQKIKFRRRKVSHPGEPPFQHSHGKQSFRHTIQFAVDRQHMTAYVGPQKVSGKVGKDVPRTLEFGGMTGPAPNPTWYQVNGVPADLNNVSSIAAWLLKEGVGPLFMAGSANGVINQATGKKHSSREIAEYRSQNPDKYMFRHMLKRKIPVKDGKFKKVYYYLLPIKSEKQATQAAENIVKFYGLPKIKPHYISPRPFMGPTLANSKNSLAQFFAKPI